MKNLNKKALLIVGVVWIVLALIVILAFLAPAVLIGLFIAFGATLLSFGIYSIINESFNRQ